jgi:hypothetical protein
MKDRLISAMGREALSTGNRADGSAAFLPEAVFLFPDTFHFLPVSLQDAETSDGGAAP